MRTCRNFFHHPALSIQPVPGTARFRPGSLGAELLRAGAPCGAARLPPPPPLLPVTTVAAEKAEAAAATAELPPPLTRAAAEQFFFMAEAACGDLRGCRSAGRRGPVVLCCRR